MLPVPARQLLLPLIVGATSAAFAAGHARSLLPPARSCSGVLAAASPPPHSAAEADTEWLPLAYTAAGTAASVAWTACSAAALTTYKPHRIVHNSIGVAQALTALPTLWACSAALSSAARRGSEALRSVACRRLNLALAAACIWSAVAVIWAPAFTAANVRTVDPVRYAPPLRVAAASTYTLAAALCVAVWRRSVAAPSFRRVVQGVLVSMWQLGPPRDASSTGARRGSAAEHAAAAEHASLALAFGAFSALAAFAPFPLATVPSLLGKRLARAYGAWTLLAAGAWYTLMFEAGGEAGGGTTRTRAAADATAVPLAARLQRGLRRSCAAHLVVAAARPAFESSTLYPAAMACRPAVVVSMCVYALGAVAAGDERRAERGRA